MKRTRCIELLVIGSALSIGGCTRSEDLQQQVYRSREDCVRDWGDEQSCPPGGQAASGYASSYYSGGYYGPRYYWDHAAGRPVAVASDGTTRPVMTARIGSGGSSVGATVHAGSFARGGFGSLARAFGGGRGG